VIALLAAAGPAGYAVIATVHNVSESSPQQGSLLRPCTSWRARSIPGHRGLSPCRGAADDLARTTGLPATDRSGLQSGDHRIAPVACPAAASSSMDGRGQPPSSWRRPPDPAKDPWSRLPILPPRPARLIILRKGEDRPPERWPRTRRRTTWRCPARDDAATHGRLGGIRAVGLGGCRPS
jgi:hypothetical protein